MPPPPRCRPGAAGRRPPGAYRRCGAAGPVPPGCRRAVPAGPPPGPPRPRGSRRADPCRPATGAARRSRSSRCGRSTTVDSAYAAGPARPATRAPAMTSGTARLCSWTTARNRKAARHAEDQDAEPQPGHVVRGPAEQQEGPHGGRGGRRGQGRPTRRTVPALPGLVAAHADEGGDGRGERDGVVRVEDAGHEAEGQPGDEQPAAPDDVGRTARVGARHPAAGTTGRRPAG